jgi:hypothetical protein
MSEATWVRLTRTAEISVEIEHQMAALVDSFGQRGRHFRA